MMAEGNEYQPTGVVSPILLEKEKKTIEQIDEIGKLIPKSIKPLQVRLDEEKKRYDAEIDTIRKRCQEIKYAEDRRTFISGEIERIKKTIAHRAKLRNITPDYNTKSIIDLENTLKSIVIPEPIDTEPRTEKIKSEFADEVERCKNLNKKRTKLNAKLKMIREEILKDKWLPAYKQYADENGLTDQIDQNDNSSIFDVCNEHYKQIQSCRNRTIDCDCGCDGESYDGDAHTFTFGDSRCSYFTKVSFDFREVEPIGMIGIEVLPAYTYRS